MTRIVVLLKDIVDLNEMKIDPSTRKPSLEGVKRRISDLDKRALEAAIRLKEAHGGEIATLSVGNPKTRTVMLEALAMGADASYIVNDASLTGLDALANRISGQAAAEEPEGLDEDKGPESHDDSAASGDQAGPDDDAPSRDETDSSGEDDEAVD